MREGCRAFSSSSRMRGRFVFCCACLCASVVARTFDDETDDPWSYAEDDAGGPDGVLGFDFANSSEINKFNDDGWDANGASDQMVSPVTSLAAPQATGEPQVEARPR